MVMPLVPEASSAVPNVVAVGSKLLGKVTSKLIRQPSPLGHATGVDVLLLLVTLRKIQSEGPL